MEVRSISEAEFEGFVRGFEDPLLRDLAQYERWKSGLRLLRVFWAEGERLTLLGLKGGEKIQGVLRVLKVPFLERKRWGGEGKERGEVQDVFPQPLEVEGLKALLAGAEEILAREGPLHFGISEWKEPYWEALERLGFSPYARSVLIAWDTKGEIPKEGNPAVEIRLASLEMKATLRRIQRSSWGFFIPPDFERQDVLVAFLDGQPVGSAYLNRLTHHIDFGVHVRREFQRRRVGTAILREALRLCRERGARRMFVTRVLRAIAKINESDRVALRFYLDCGGQILREYRGFRRKRRPRPLAIPPLSEF